MLCHQRRPAASFLLPWAVLLCIFVALLAPISPAAAHGGDPHYHHSGSGHHSSRRLLQSASLADSGSTGSTLRRCAVIDPAPHKVASNELALQRSGAASDIATYRWATLTIRVVFHVLVSDADNTTGYLPQSIVQAQVDAMNKAHAAQNTGFTFALWSTQYHYTPYFRGCTPDTAPAMGAAFAVDPAHFLNMYTCEPSGGLLGWVLLFPQQAAESDTRHGVWVSYRTLPGVSSQGPYNLGATAIHEVGHYMGLYHTFQGGCSSDPVNGGDAVADTKAEAQPFFGTCPLSVQLSTDTCPAIPGVDPIQNYMDYSDDICMSKLTAGQTSRMQLIISTYRSGLVAVGGGGESPLPTPPPPTNPPQPSPPPPPPPPSPSPPSGPTTSAYSTPTVTAQSSPTPVPTPSGSHSSSSRLTGAAYSIRDNNGR